MNPSNILRIVGTVLGFPSAVLLISSENLGLYALSQGTTQLLEIALYTGGLLLFVSLWRDAKSTSMKVCAALLMLATIVSLFFTLTSNPLSITALY